MKVSAEAKRIARQELKDFRAGKRSFCNSPENIQALFDVVQDRKDSIERAVKALMAR